MNIDPSFADRWQCFYCCGDLQPSELLAKQVCCDTCHLLRMIGGKRPRVLVARRTMPIDMTRRAYISIPYTSLECLKSVTVPDDADNVSVHVYTARNGVASVIVTMTDPEWLAEQEELRRLAELEAGAA